jgi:DNA primase
VRERARIEDLFPAGSLKRAGAAFLATCPWHDDRRPSLSVNPGRNRAHCFVCNRGVDAIGWIQEQQGLGFREAVEELARRYGIPIPEQDPQAAARAEAEQRERARLLALRQEQQERFQRALAADLARDGPAAAFLRQRGLTTATAQAWGLGLNGQRLMLPIRDSQGRCCGFSGRSLTGQEPKYRNTTADALFRRSELLYGLDRAAPVIRRSGEALLVEGPLDVLQLHQGGIEHAIAAMGTALAPGQRQALQRTGARRLLLALDGDGPGRAASGALISDLRPMLVAAELELAVVVLPAGSDPDDLLRREGADAFRARLQRAEHWLGWELEQLLAPFRQAPDDLGVLQRCETAGRKLLAVLPAGPLRRRAEHTLRQVLGAVPEAPVPAQEAETGSRVATTLAIERAEWRALRLFIASPDSRPLLAGLLLQTPLHRRAMEVLLEVQRRLPRDAGEPEHDPLARVVKGLCGRLEPELGGLLQQLCRDGLEVQQMLGGNLEGEVMAVLDVLEPVREESSASPSSPRQWEQCDPAHHR